MKAPFLEPFMALEPAEHQPKEMREHCSKCKHSVLVAAKREQKPLNPSSLDLLEPWPLAVDHQIIEEAGTAHKGIPQTHDQGKDVWRSLGNTMGKLGLRVTAWRQISHFGIHYVQIQNPNKHVTSSKSLFKQTTHLPTYLALFSFRGII